MCRTTYRSTHGRPEVKALFDRYAGIRKYGVAAETLNMYIFFDDDGGVVNSEASRIEINVGSTVVHGERAAIQGYVCSASATVFVSPYDEATSTASYQGDAVEGYGPIIKSHLLFTTITSVLT